MSKDFNQLSKRHKSRLIAKETSQLLISFSSEIQGGEEKPERNDSPLATDSRNNDCNCQVPVNFSETSKICAQIPNNAHNVNDVTPETNETVDMNASLGSIYSDNFDSDVVYSDMSDEDVYNSSYESDDNSEGENDLAQELRDIVADGHLTHKTTNSLLRLLRKHGHDELPKDRRTLMKTSRNISFELQSLGEGQYFHFGLESCIARSIKT